ncbi:MULTISPECIES: DUF4234 domain-containing protein [Rhodopseudomonas]|jgi:uncharacterized membrane protein|uniref:Uncharacterized protein n=1 Tax=Rhodopseudomonas palustris (strain DX-1) TaxID=652103 RepID=E6VEA4_RHOPX|nr:MULTISPECIES: DUF4234 domain-containing protein [Rhodopseudomonas]NEW90143.1 hypothetical protein [Rhodopseudomonas sp. WA056]QDL96056.1 hypothetical protein FLL57_01490 [Rhodopseudomonas palustris]
MPPLLVLAGSLVGIAMVRWAFRTAGRVNQELEVARATVLADVDRATLPTLRPDPVTGAYRPG